MIKFDILKLMLYLAGITIMLRLIMIKINQYKLIGYIASIGFILNFAWEMFQMPFYVNYKTFADHIVCIPASLGDVVLVLGIYTVVSYVRNDWYWIRNIEKRTITLTILLGALIAIIMEQRALMLGLWSYTPNMPITPLFKVGLLPVLQMLILPLLTYLLTNKIIYKKLEEIPK